MIVKRSWEVKKYGKWVVKTKVYVGWFLFGFIPLYIVRL